MRKLFVLFLVLASICLAGASPGRAETTGKLYEYKTTVKYEVIYPFMAPRPTEEPRQADFSLWVPDNIKVAKGLIAISMHGSGTAFFNDKQVRDMAAELGLAMVAFVGDGVQRGVAPGVLEAALTELGRLSAHPEIIDAPMVTFGMSNGCGFSTGYTIMKPERVFAWITYHPGGPLFFSRRYAAKTVDLVDSYYPGNTWVRKTPSPLFSVPGLVMLGEVDQFAYFAQEDPEKNCIMSFENVRREHKPAMQVIVEPGVAHGHKEGRSWTIVMEFIRTTFKMRLPADADPSKGPVKLKAVDTASGWLGMNWNLKTGGGQDLPVMAFADYKGDIGKTSWLPTKEYALKWQEFSKNGTLQAAK